MNNNSHGWIKYDRSVKPTPNIPYLVLLKQERAVDLGFGNNIPVLTAMYNSGCDEWQSVGCTPGIHKLDDIVIAWREIPQPPNELKE